MQFNKYVSSCIIFAKNTSRLLKESFDTFKVVGYKVCNSTEANHSHYQPIRMLTGLDVPIHVARHLASVSTSGTTSSPGRRRDSQPSHVQVSRRSTKQLQTQLLKRVGSATFSLRCIAHYVKQHLCFATTLVRSISQQIPFNIRERNAWKQIYISLQVKNGRIKVFHIPPFQQTADIFTKNLPSTLFNDFKVSLDVRESTLNLKERVRIYGFTKS